MALVSYDDSDSSDVEEEKEVPKRQQEPIPAPKPTTDMNPQSLPPPCEQDQEREEDEIVEEVLPTTAVLTPTSITTSANSTANANSINPWKKQRKSTRFVDRSQPRKFVVDLAGKGRDVSQQSQSRSVSASGAATKTDNDNNGDNGDGDDEQPAQKRARVGGGGGGFFSLNSVLPPPKGRASATAAAARSHGERGAAGGRRPFSFKTGAEKGFDREADAELRHTLDAGEDGDTPATSQEHVAAKSSNTNTAIDGTITGGNGNGDGKKQSSGNMVVRGNPLAFKPLSVMRSNAKKKPAKKTSASPAATAPPDGTAAPTAAAANPPAKPKISLFGGGGDANDSRPTTDTIASNVTPSTYQPLMTEMPSAPEPEADEGIYDSTTAPPQPTTSDGGAGRGAGGATGGSQSLAGVAKELNLSSAEMRQLFGRGATKNASSGLGVDASVLHFNTNEEYASNAAFLSSKSEQEIAAQQHNPVRAVAPGKHSLQQLVNAASSQREALEESFAAGKRNRQEAGSKYGW